MRTVRKLWIQKRQGRVQDKGTVRTNKGLNPDEGVPWRYTPRRREMMSVAELVLYLLGVSVIGLGVGLIVQFWREAHSTPSDPSK